MSLHGRFDVVKREVSSGSKQVTGRQLARCHRLVLKEVPRDSCE